MHHAPSLVYIQTRCCLSTISAHLKPIWIYNLRLDHQRMVIISLSHPTGVQTELMKKPFFDSFYPKYVCVKDNVLYFWFTSPNLYSKLYKLKRKAKEITLLKQLLSRTATYVAPVYTQNVIHGVNVSSGSQLYATHI